MSKDLGLENSEAMQQWENKNTNIISTKDYFMEVQEELLELHNQTIEGEISNLDVLIKMRKAKADAEKVLEIVKTFEDERLNEIATEAESYGGTYCGFEIKAVNGRKMFNYKQITQITELENQKKTLEDKFKNAFEGFQKGIVQTTEVDGVRYWIDEDGELQLFPELTIGKSFLQIKDKNKK